MLADHCLMMQWIIKRVDKEGRCWVLFCCLGYLELFDRIIFLSWMLEGYYFEDSS